MGWLPVSWQGLGAGFLALLLLLVGVGGMADGSTGQPVILPIEIVGPDGTTADAVVDIREALASRIHGLWMMVHNLTYAEMVSVQVNSSPWLPLNNQTAAIAEPGKSYGGIGGGFATLRLTLPLPAGAVAGGANSVRFRFNRSNGLASGFRVLAFNFVTDDGQMVLPGAAFAQEDPQTWAPPRRDRIDIAMGKRHWYTAPLVANNAAGAPKIQAHCADCHAHDGRDLKYFNFSNRSIVARSQFHGLSALEGEQIASYIRSLQAPNPGRPWNPPYQPGPGLDAQPVENWAAGAGLAWVLDREEDSLPFLFNPGGAPGDLRIAPETFRPDGNLNPREIPIALQLPDWSHWLPRVHPLDAWGSDFPHSELYQWYDNPERGLRAHLASRDVAKFISSGDVVSFFDRWSKAQHKFLTSHVERAPGGWSPELTDKVYSTQLWQLVKAWEVAQEFRLEGRGREFYGATGEPRTWFNTASLAAAPAAAGVPDGPNGMGGSALTNEYYDNAWYQVQLLVNTGNHRRHGREPIDWPYVVGRFKAMYLESHHPEPARLLVAIVKALQSADPKFGPDNQVRGWRPDNTVDPRILVSSEWSPIFQPLDPTVRRAITEAFLTAWLEKNLKYRTSQYFNQGTTSLREAYALPKELGGITGGNVWLSAPQFQAAGVSQDTVARLLKWGRAYAKMAASLHY
jgi:hypothetical protein